MSKNLNENQLLAVQLVAQGRSGKEIAEKLLVSEETVSRWKKLPKFIASVNEILHQLREITQQKMRNLVLKSLDILEEELDQPESKIKHQIALKILNNYKFNKLLDLEIGSENPETIIKIKKDKEFSELF